MASFYPGLVSFLFAKLDCNSTELNDCLRDLTLSAFYCPESYRCALNRLILKLLLEFIEFIRLLVSFRFRFFGFNYLLWKTSGRSTIMSTSDYGDFDRLYSHLFSDPVLRIIIYWTNYYWWLFKKSSSDAFF